MSTSLNRETGVPSSRRNFLCKVASSLLIVSGVGMGVRRCIEGNNDTMRYFRFLEHISPGIDRSQILDAWKNGKPIVVDYNATHFRIYDPKDVPLPIHAYRNDKDSDELLYIGSLQGDSISKEKPIEDFIRKIPENTLGLGKVFFDRGDLFRRAQEIANNPLTGEYNFRLCVTGYPDTGDETPEVFYRRKNVGYMLRFIDTFLGISLTYSDVFKVLEEEEFKRKFPIEDISKLSGVDLMHASLYIVSKKSLSTKFHPENTLAENFSQCGARDEGSIHRATGQVTYTNSPYLSLYEGIYLQMTQDHLSSLRLHTGSSPDRQKNIFEFLGLFPGGSTPRMQEGKGDDSTIRGCISNVYATLSELQKGILEELRENKLAFEECRSGNAIIARTGGSRYDLKKCSSRRDILNGFKSKVAFIDTLSKKYPLFYPLLKKTYPKLRKDSFNMSEILGILGDEKNGPIFINALYFTILFFVNYPDALFTQSIDPVNQAKALGRPQSKESPPINQSLKSFTQVMGGTEEE